jgi:hypothetical protein
MLMNVTGGQTKAGNGLHPPNLISSPPIRGGYIMKRTNARDSQFPDDEDRNGHQNISLRTAQPSDTAPIHRKFYKRIFYIEGTQNQI